jgi:phosphoglycerate kinase
MPRSKCFSCRLGPALFLLRLWLRQQVSLVEDCIGEPVEKAVAAMKNGDVVLLENVRFYKQEEKNEPEFAKAVRVGGA